MMMINRFLTSFETGDFRNPFDKTVSLFFTIYSERPPSFYSIKDYDVIQEVAVYRLLDVSHTLWHPLKEMG